MNNNIDDTIVAISTPVGEGGIGIVRLSGAGSLAVADAIFSSSRGKRPSRLKSYTAHYGRVIDTRLDERPAIDEVILNIMRAPKSYTREDVVEINCHGGIVPLKKILELVMSFGVRLAEPGEFTRRAFLNGRIDLAQAESVLDIIKARTDTGLRAAMNQLGGELSRNVAVLRGELLDLISRVEASIDFPEEETGGYFIEGAAAGMKAIVKEIRRLESSADKGMVLTEGLRAVICGRPNVGKSSLMNALLRRSRVIVSHIPGTTRDTIEELINIEGLPVRLVDTAGIIDSDDLLIKEGVDRSRLHIESSDLLLLVLDGSEPLNAQDHELIRAAADKRAMVVINKSDLPRKADLGEARIRELLGQKRSVEISAKDRRGLDALEGSISSMVWDGEVCADHTCLVTNARHKTLLSSAADALERGLGAAEKGAPPEIVSIEFKEAAEALGRITGESIDGEVLDRIFERFCIGK